MWVSECVFIDVQNKKQKKIDKQTLSAFKSRRDGRHTAHSTRLTVIELIASVSQVMQAGRQAKQTLKGRKRESANGNVF